MVRNYKYLNLIFLNIVILGLNSLEFISSKSVYKRAGSLLHLSISPEISADKLKFPFNLTSET